MVVGGATDGTTPLASVEQFDPRTNHWTSGGTIKEARWGHSTILLTDGQALVVGGYGFATLRSAEIYKPAGGGWHSGDSLARRSGLAEGITRAGKLAASYDHQSPDPLSLRERAGVRVKCLPLSAHQGRGDFQATGLRGRTG